MRISVTSKYSVIFTDIPSDLPAGDVRGILLHQLSNYLIK